MIVGRVTAAGGAYPYSKGVYIEIIGAHYDVNAGVAYARVRPLGSMQGRGDLVRLPCVEALPHNAPLCTCGLAVAKEDGQHPRCKPTANVARQSKRWHWGGRAWDSKY